MWAYVFLLWWQELLIQQLQDEISRLRRHTSTPINAVDSSDNNTSQLHDKTVVELREQLRKATSHIKQLADDKRVLIEVGNRLRAELMRNGNSSTAFGHLPAAVYLYVQFLKFQFLLLLFVWFSCSGLCSIHTRTRTHVHTHTHTHTQLFNGRLSGTTRVGRYQKKHSPTHTHPDHRTSFISFRHLQRSMASSLFSLRAWQFTLWQPLSRSCLVFPLVLDPHLHTPCISSTVILYHLPPFSTIHELCCIHSLQFFPVVKCVETALSPLYFYSYVLATYCFQHPLFLTFYDMWKLCRERK